MVKYGIKIFEPDSFDADISPEFSSITDVSSGSSEEISEDGVCASDSSELGEGGTDTPKEALVCSADPDAGEEAFCSP